MRLGRQFRDRIEYLLDNKFRLPADAEYPDLDSLAYLSYASHAGHGIGLWEADEPWHSSFEKVVMADKQARDLGYQLDEEVHEGLIAAGEVEPEDYEGNSARGRRARFSDKQRQQWMKKFNHLMGDPQPKPYDYWDTAYYLMNQGFTPQEAAAKKGRPARGRRAEGRLRVYKSLKNLSKKAGRPISLEQITSGRINLPGVGWTSFRYSLTDEDAAAIAEALGGWDRTQNTVARVLRYGGAGRLDSWMRDRIQYDPREGWHYIAGQDYRWDTNKIRRALS
jgi:hypothetical protein